MRPILIARPASRVSRRGSRTPAALATFVFGALLLTAASAATPATPEACGTASPAQATSAETRVRFAARDAEIVVRLADNPTGRDFASMLPLTLEFRDFMEKISDLPRELMTEGSSSGAPANGDLSYFVPWGNLGFFYDAERRDRSFDDQVIPVGTVETGYERLDALETGPVCAERLP